jgi:hypothetical protein
MRRVTILACSAMLFALSFSARGAGAAENPPDRTSSGFPPRVK